MPRRPLHEFNAPDQRLVEQLPPEFWTLMRSMLRLVGLVKEAKLTMQHDDIKPTDDLTLEVVRITAHTWKVPQEHRFYTEHDKVPFPDFDRTDAGTLIKPPAPEQIEEVVWTSREPDKMPADLPLS